MAASKLTDLLPIPDGPGQSHAYQVFGLEPGEQDAAKISKAVNATVAKLKAAKSSTDEKLWNRAAKLVQDARVTLVDPIKKAELDARFGIVSIDQDCVAPTDPLAAVLPQSDPLAPVQIGPVDGSLTSRSESPSTVPAAESGAIAVEGSVPPAIAMPPGVFGTPTPEPVDPRASVEIDSAEPLPAATGSVVIAAAANEKPQRASRRKKQSLALVAFSIFTCAMLGMIGWLAHYMIYGPGPVAITNSDGTVSIETQNGKSGVSRRGDSPRRPLDPVMGELGRDTNGPTRIDQPTGVSAPADDSKDNFAAFFPDATGSAGGSETTMATDDAGPMTVKDSDASERGPDPAAQASSLTDEKIAEAEEALRKVRTLIREADWTQMKVAAESALKMQMTEQQKWSAQALYEFADLATYYRGSIQRAVADLEVGSEFAVTKSFQVVIVDRGDDFLEVRYNAKNRSFKFDEFPFSLAHKLATFSMSDSPTTQAAKAAYQAIVPNATDGHRNEAIAWLRTMEGDVEGADPERLAKTIEMLFPTDA